MTSRVGRPSEAMLCKRMQTSCTGYSSDMRAVDRNRTTGFPEQHNEASDASLLGTKLEKWLGLAIEKILRSGDRGAYVLRELFARLPWAIVDGQDGALQGGPVGGMYMNALRGSSTLVVYTKAQYTVLPKLKTRDKQERKRGRGGGEVRGKSSAATDGLMKRTVMGIEEAWSLGGLRDQCRAPAGGAPTMLQVGGQPAYAGLGHAAKNFRGWGSNSPEP